MEAAYGFLCAVGRRHPGERCRQAPPHACAQPLVPIEEEDSPYEGLLMVEAA